MMERSAGHSLWGAFQARLDCTFLHRTDQRRSARLLRSLTQLERRKWDLNTLIGRPSESLTLRAAQGEAHAGLTGKWRWVPLLKSSFCGMLVALIVILASRAQRFYPLICALVVSCVKALYTVALKVVTIKAFAERTSPLATPWRRHATR